MIDRRRMLQATTAMVGGSVIGCNGSQEAEPSGSSTAQSTGRNVPLRVLLVGSEQDAAAITRGWGAVAEKELAIQTISTGREAAPALASEVLAGTTKCDVLIYPLILVSELDASDSITSLSDEELLEYQEAGDLYAALRSGAASYSGKNIGIPIGAPLPALIAQDGLPDNFESETVDWQAYDQMVATEWGGSAGEPTGPGWAAAMFLWRAAGIASWLFDRETMEPLISTEPYVQALTQMQTTHARYAAKSQTPEAIWNGVVSGELRGGIGFPSVRSAGNEPSVIRTLPGMEQASGVPLDPFSRVISLSINCRQSGSAKQFMRWMSGGEGSSATRSQVAGMTDTRVQLTPEDSSVGSSSTPGYDRWLSERLASPITLPTLKIRQGAYYYQVLDEQIGRALNDNVDPAAALKTAADLWQAKTQEIGKPAQQRAWRRAQGMRG